jgi:hypothetical protein
MLGKTEYCLCARFQKYIHLQRQAHTKGEFKVECATAAAAEKEKKKIKRKTEYSIYIKFKYKSQCY